jgi:hypothetical protein
MSNIPSILDDARFRRLVLESLNSVTSSTTSLVGFNIPPYNDVVMLYQNASFPTKPTFITFKQDGTIVYEVTLTYDANGALTRVYES